MTRRRAWLAVLFFPCVLWPGVPLAAQAAAPSDATLAAVTARGRMLAEYDIAAWHATDAVGALNPDTSAAPFYIARKTANTWEVVFGRLNQDHDRFFIVYRATQGAKPEEFTAKKETPPAEDRGYYAAGARAIEIAVRDFGRQDRNYNTYLLPSGDGRLYVYLLPAPSADTDYPLGRDARYTVTLDGSTIVEKRMMHQGMVDEDSPPGSKHPSGTHTHDVSNSPEDSDVFYVLTRKPALEESITTGDKHLYAIAVDGKIKRVK